MRRTCLAAAMILVLVSLFTVTAEAAVIQVPDPGNGIVSLQDGIDAAVDGDEVVAATGTYNNINFNGKGITVRSEDGPDTTFIKGNVIFLDVVTLASGEGADSVLRGFTIRNGMIGSCIALHGASPIIEENVIEYGSDLDTGSGIKMFSSQAVIRNNVIRNNSVARMGAGGGPIKGGGIYVSSGTPVIENNFILDNIQSCGVGFCMNAYGAGIYVTGGAAHIFGNVLAGNRTAPAASEWGGAIYIESTSGAVVANNTIYGNHAQYETMVPGKHGGGGIYIAADNTSLLVTNNIIQANGTFGVLCASASVDATFQTNSLFGNGTSDYEDCPAGTGDLFVDAELADPVGDDFHLLDTSPLMDAGITPLSFSPPDLDIYGDARLTDGDGSGTVEIDIGAAELPAVIVPGWAVADAANASTVSPDGSANSRWANLLFMAGVPLLFGLMWRRLRRRG